MVTVDSELGGYLAIVFGRPVVVLLIDVVADHPAEGAADENI